MALNLQPGAGRLLAFVPAPLAAIRVTAPAKPLIAGHALRLKIDILDVSGNAVPGSFPLELRVQGPRTNRPRGAGCQPAEKQQIGNLLHGDGPNGEIAGLRRSFSAESGSELSLATAWNDPPGDWTISVTDGISGLCGTARSTPRPTRRPPLRRASSPGDNLRNGSSRQPSPTNSSSTACRVWPPCTVRTTRPPAG